MIITEEHRTNLVRDSTGCGIGVVEEENVGSFGIGRVQDAGGGEMMDMWPSLLKK